MHYRSFTDQEDWDPEQYTIFLRTFFSQGKVYFCARTGIYIFDPETEEHSYMDTPENAVYSFILNEELYCGDWGLGLVKFKTDEIIQVPGGSFFKEKVVSGLINYDESSLLVSTYKFGLFKLDSESGGLDSTFIDPVLNSYLKENVITYLDLLNGDILVGTSFGGLVILDNNGQAKEIISEPDGMIDKTVAWVHTDKRLLGSAPLWIANWKGISKVETNHPFRVFTEASGFEGLIMDVKVFDEKLFMATLGGLYYKSSTETGTYFKRVEGLQDQFKDLHIFKPARGIELLLASGDNHIYVIDKNLRISTIDERILNPPPSEEVESYTGKDIIGNPEQPDMIYIGLSALVGLQYQRGYWKEVFRYDELQTDLINKLVIDKYGYIWVSAPYRILRVDLSPGQQITEKIYNAANGLPTDESNTVYLDPDTEEVLIGTFDGFYRYNYFRDSLFYDTIYNRVLPEGENLIQTFHKDQEGDYWFSFENNDQWTELVARKSGTELEVIHEKSFLRLPDASVDVFCDDPASGVWFSKSDELYHFDKSFSRNDTLPFQTLIRRIVLNGDSLLYNGTSFREDENGGYQIHAFQEEDTQPEIKHRYNNIEFRWAAPYFEQEDKLKYSYKLTGFDKQWSEWTEAVYKDYTNLRFGSYCMHVKAMNVYGDESITASYSFTILRPWYASIPAIIAYILLSGLVIFLIIKLYTRRLKQENIQLEGIIQERTAEIRKQKEELTDSIEYASRIQRALLPPDRLMDQHGIEHFILFRPRDIVSGDFYWMGSKNGKIMIVAADCTGHGVPGAFMSRLGMTFLDEIVIKSEITSTDEILEQLRDHVITSLKQSGKSMEESTKDGMDLAVIALDPNTNKIQFSGAYNPLYLVRKLKRGEKTKLKNGEELDLPRGSIHDDEYLLLQIRADQMPIGISEKTMRFTATSFKDEGFNIYMFSDGFLDQFGGPQGKKFMSKNFKKLILELQSIPLGEQGAALEKILLGWMGEISQIDDILVMGLRMNQQ